MKKSVAALAAIVVLFTAVGCAEQPLGAGRLSDSKAPAQLLRVEAVSRIPDYMVDSEGEPDERSRACDASDPLGKERFWRSSIDVFLLDNASVQPAMIVDEVVASFEEQDWVAEEGATSLIVNLKKEMLATTIQITRTPMDTGGTITVAVDGPCVMTDGQEDPEVRKLDGRP